MDDFEDHTLETDYETDAEDVLHSERTIKDPIHDQIPLPDFACKFIDTKEFQRLRHIKQLGTSYYVWPGAAHNRFEHCIGVMHLAGLLVQHLQQAQPELEITRRDIECVMLAGLCHDLGHGPWSHVWDGLFIPAALPNLEKPWTHEQGSEMMLDHLVAHNNIGRPQSDYDFIKALIAGEHERVPHEKAYLFDIISNKRNGMDVDKFDYLLRDSKMLGMMHNCIDAARIIRSARVIGDQICYEVKDADSLYDVGELRYKLHKKIYHHKTAKAIEYMIIDALILAEPYMKIAHRVFQPDKYLHLTDEIMGWIEANEDPNLKPAQKILERIRKRDHYRRVDHGRFGWFEMDMCKKYITAEAITKEARQIIEEVRRGVPPSADTAPSSTGAISTSAPTVDPSAITVDPSATTFDPTSSPKPLTDKDMPDDNVIVALSPLHYGMKDKNPLEGLKFYNRKLNPDQARPAGPGDYSTLAPEVCGEVLIQIFTKDKAFYGVVQNAYRRVVEKAKSQAMSPLLASPEIKLPTPDLTTAPSSRSPAQHATPPSTPPPKVSGGPSPALSGGLGGSPALSGSPHVGSPHAHFDSPHTGSPHPVPAPRAKKPLSTYKQSSFSEVPVTYDGTPAPRKTRRLGRVVSSGSDVFNGGGGRGGGSRGGSQAPPSTAGSHVPPSTIGKKRDSPDDVGDEKGREGKKRRTEA
ncbi:HD-domain/PDEase-like protein [Schizophyllum commune Tattone D]|nr:HD-domain/PDEase-like protein [Schizophyllum commune Tattone D]